jgi:hypothetical protein
LYELRRLEQGWHDGSGNSITPTSLAVAGQFLPLKPHLCGLYKIYPIETGGILIEFELAGWDYSVEISESGSVEFFGIEIEGPKELAVESFEGINADFKKKFDSIITTEPTYLALR